MGIHMNLGIHTAFNRLHTTVDVFIHDAFIHTPFTHICYQHSYRPHTARSTYISPLLCIQSTNSHADMHSYSSPPSLTVQHSYRRHWVRVTPLQVDILTSKLRFIVISYFCHESEDTFLWLCQIVWMVCTRASDSQCLWAFKMLELSTVCAPWSSKWWVNSDGYCMNPWV